jgi:hypothetical protein
MGVEYAMNAGTALSLNGVGVLGGLKSFAGRDFCERSGEGIVNVRSDYQFLVGLRHGLARLIICFLLGSVVVPENAHANKAVKPGIPRDATTEVCEWESVFRFGEDLGVGRSSIHEQFSSYRASRLFTFLVSKKAREGGICNGFFSRRQIVSALEMNNGDIKINAPMKRVFFPNDLEPRSG